MTSPHEAVAGLGLFKRRRRMGGSCRSPNLVFDQKPMAAVKSNI